MPYCVVLEIFVLFYKDEGPVILRAEEVFRCFIILIAQVASRFGSVQHAVVLKNLGVSVVCYLDMNHKRQFHTFNLMLLYSHCTLRCWDW